MSNSSLVSFTKISPNKNSPRNHQIDTITIHCFVGQASAETICNIFAAPDKKVSCNYGIGTDGRIGLCVEEKDRSWCSSDGPNDHRAITIECASDTTPPYAINSKVYDSLIALCVDVCKRNGIKELKWKADKSLIGQVDKQNMTVHRWFANKSCPGDYIYSRLGQIAAEVNSKLGASVSVPTNPVTPSPAKKSLDDIAREVIAGNWGNGDARANALNKAGYNYVDVQNRVNSILAGKSSTPAPAPAPVPVKKSLDDIAREVIAGNWGNGDARINALRKAGYNYTDVQNRVNSILAGKPVGRSSNEAIAEEVIKGKWGNGSDRKARLTAAGYNYDSIQKIVNQML